MIIVERKEKAVSKLIAKGANTNAKNDSGKTASDLTIVHPSMDGSRKV
jgi:hypothetical protein